MSKSHITIKVRTTSLIEYVDTKYMVELVKLKLQISGYRRLLSVESFDDVDVSEMQAGAPDREAGPANRHQIQDSHGCAERVPTSRSSLNLSTLVFPECTARVKNMKLDVDFTIRYLCTCKVIAYQLSGRGCNTPHFQLSQNAIVVPLLLGKLNKSNYYLELSMQNADLPIDDCLVNFLVDDLISNGGQLEMVVNLLEESAISTLRAKKEELMQEVYTIMSATLGIPPKPDAPITLEYYTEDGKYANWEGTPLQFYKAFTAKYSPTESFLPINDPQNDYGKLYTMDKLGNIWGGRPVLYVNTQIDDLKQAVSIKAGQPVFFGCDVGQFSNSGKGVGIMDTDYLHYERLQTNKSAMTHAMVISGVHVDEKTGRPVRFKVENSWGEDSGVQGFNVMSEKWFNQFVFQVVVHKSFLRRQEWLLLKAIVEYLGTASEFTVSLQDHIRVDNIQAVHMRVFLKDFLDLNI
ncbi:peptidase C1B bleomycin hydrolase [Suillus cothurnatus]|nr:peptidase C1B bleomycin hydrolase [Suillus cothurnatus]